MCGICGFAGERARLSAADLARMNSSLIHRGPDDEGQLVEPGVGLAMRRLSILDLEGGHQPISNEDGSIWVIFNGEIYNYRALRADLQAKGHVLRTQSDTEVIVHLYEEHGKELVHHLRGMFAFALWDRRERSLLLARDRLGIKPLFYSYHEGTLLFGSEIKAILQSGLVPTDINWQAVDAYLTLTYIPAPYTIYKSVSKLPAGSRLSFKDGRCVQERYWDIDLTSRDTGASAEEWESRIEDKLFDAVKSHLVSDVPLGAFLSGGIDSSLVVAMMSKALGTPVETFTMGFAGNGLGLRDERPYARLLGSRYHAAYNEFTVEPHFEDILDEILTAFDEPFADDSIIPSYYISQLTRQKVKVALSGLGGDELFGGYHRYRGLLLSKPYGVLPRFVRRGIAEVLVDRFPEPSGGSDRIDHVKRFARFAALPPDQRYLGYVSSLDVAGRRRLYRRPLLEQIDFEATSAVITQPFNACGSEDLLDRAFYTDLMTYLPDDILALSDRMSMWHSLELRVPLIDHELAELAAKMPPEYKVRLRSTKWLLRRIAQRWLPSEIVTHRKQGFESPMAAWLRNDLREYAEGILTDPAIERLGLFDRREIARLFDLHCSGQQKNNKILLSLLILFRWMTKNVVR
jgi:asparagine synthase (glutamine-hydrolysing)